MKLKTLLESQAIYIYCSELHLYVCIIMCVCVIASTHLRPWVYKTNLHRLVEIPEVIQSQQC